MPTDWAEFEPVEHDWQDFEPVGDTPDLLRPDARPVPRDSMEKAAQNFAMRRLPSGAYIPDTISGSEPFKLGGTEIIPVPDAVGLPSVRAPEDAGAIEKVAAGAYNTLASIPNFMLRPEGVAAALVPASIPLRFAAPLLKGTFMGLMAKGAGEAAGKASVTKDAQDVTEALGAAAMIPLIARAPGETVVERTPNAIQPESTQLLRPVREKPIQGAGQVPAPVSGEQINARGSEATPQQPTGTPEAVPAETPIPVTPEVLAKALGTRVAGEGPFGILLETKNAKGEPGTSFIVKPGSTLEQAKAAYEATRKRFEGDPDQPAPLKEAGTEPAKAEPVSDKEQTIKKRIESGLAPENVQVTVSKDPALPAASYIQVDETHPTEGNVFSSNPETLNKLGFKMPTTAELLKLPAGRYKLSELPKAPPETVLASQTETLTAPRLNSGLPPGLQNKSHITPPELMEASRQLGALVRSRSTLRPGVMGQFVRNKLAGIKAQDKIEVGDINDQGTVAHEIGHDIDAEVFPKHNLAKSQDSLAARIGNKVPKRELVKELTGVSEFMRGPIIGSAGHRAYRRTATELIADWFALYAHDPAYARLRAPKWTKGFEEALATNPEAAGVVHQLLEGNVKPLPPETPAVPATKPVVMAGQVPLREMEKVERETVAAKEAQNIAKDQTRLFKRWVQSARIKAEGWRKLVSSREERNDVGAFIEGIGNAELAGDTISNVRDRMTPAMEKFAKEYRHAQELQRQELNKHIHEMEAGEYLKFLEDYLGHFYLKSGNKLAGFASKWAKNSPHAKERVLPTLKDAVDYGLTPITQDPSITYELNARTNWRVATNKGLIAKIGSLKDGSGNPLIVPRGENPGGWVNTDNPLIQRVYGRKTPNGMLLWKGGAAVHPDIWFAVRNILDQPISSDFWKGYDAVNGFLRANAFAFSGFHDFTLRAAAAGAMSSPKNPLRGLYRIMERNPMTGKRELVRSTRTLGKEMLSNEELTGDAAEHGLVFSHTESEAYQKQAYDFAEKLAAKLHDVPILGKTARLAAAIQQMRQTGLWRNTHDAYKLIAYHDLVGKALSDAPPGANIKTVKENIASTLNDAFGGQEWETKFWLAPEVRKAFSRFLLAPDWTLSTIRSVPGVSNLASKIREQAPRIAGREGMPVPFEGKAGDIARAKFWSGELVALAAATVAAQYAIYRALGDPEKGDKPWVWDNEQGQTRRIDVTPIMRKMPWKDKGDPTRYYVTLGKRPEEIIHWVIEPEKNLRSKMSRPVAEIFNQITGEEGGFEKEWKRDHETFIESIPARVKSLAKQSIPFTFSGNQFLVSAPVRKGMTKFKAQQAYESIYELAADPAWNTKIKAFFRGVPSPDPGDTLQGMVEKITDAAERNGVPAELIRKRALSTVRGHHYNEYFKALEKGDEDKMNDEAEALIRLGATHRGFEQSMKTRAKLQPIELPE